jgi:hypothetical protein
MSLDTFIKIYDNDDSLFPEHLLEDLLALYEAEAEHKRMDSGFRNCEFLPLKPGIKVPGAPGNVAKEGDPDQAPAREPVFARLRNCCKLAWQKYVNTTPYGGNVYQVRAMELPNLLTYDPLAQNDHFHAHVDAWDKSTATRALSLIFYLNDVEEGGETVFHSVRDPNAGQVREPADGAGPVVQNSPKLEEHEKLKVKPRRRRLVIFPSGFPFVHEGTKPRSGKKQIVVSWLHYGKEGHQVATVPLV